MLLLIASSLGAAAPRECAVLDAKKAPCLLECPGNPILRFDLKELQGARPYLTATDDQSHAYYFDACTPLLRVTCGGAPPAGVAAVQTWGGNPPKFDGDSCAVLGSFGTRSCAVASAEPGDSSGAGPSLLCNYTGGQGQRSVGMLYECSPNLPTPTYSASQYGTSTAYEVKLRGQAACGYVYTLPLSWGSISLILFFVFVALYLGAGITYNVKVRGRQGLDMIPQLEYWKELPGLVKDGCVFSWQQAQKAYYGVRHGSAPPLDPSLSRRLAENVDGGPGAT